MKRLRVFLASVGRRTIHYSSVTPPLGLLSLAAYLRQKFDLDLKIVDLRVENYSTDELARQAAGFGADVVGFGSLTPTAHVMAEATLKVRQALPRALILMGGPHVSAFRAEAMQDTAADALVVGEGELAFEQILQVYLGGGFHPSSRRLGDRDFSGVPGLVWRNADGDVVTNPGAMPPIEDMDSLPFPAYDLIDIRKYWRLNSFSLLPPRRYLSIMTSRGCPYQCTYCHRIFGKRFRAQSPERIVAEIEHCLRTFGVDEIEILDDIFNHDTARVLEFSQLVKKRNLKFRLAFANALRGDTLTQETVDALVDAGMYYTACALESGSARVQKHMGKFLNIPRFLKGVEMIVNRRVFTLGYVMLGFPTETEAELQESIDVACASRLHSATFLTVTPYPNTELYDQVMRTDPEKLANIRYEDSNFAAIPVNLSTIPDALLFAIQRKAWRRFYLDPRRLGRLVRDFPGRAHLPYYLPVYLIRLTKGLFGSSGH